MKKFLSKFSPLGLKLVFIHVILVLLIPAWVKLFPSSSSCGLFPCIFSEELGYFLLFNMPGLFVSGFILPMLQILKSEDVRRSGNFTLVDYIPIYVVSAIFYYLVGFLIELILSGKSYRLKIKKVAKGNKNI